MKEKLRKFKVIIIGSIVFLILLFILIGLLIFYNRKVKMKEYSNDIYSIKYDSTWKLKEKSNNYLLLSHSKNNTIEVSVKTLDEDTRYNDIDTFIDNIKQSITDENKDYKLISEENTTLTKKSLDSYKFLYEADDNQAMVVVSKYNNKIFTIIYKAKDSEFDILLDSVDNIISNFNIKDDSVSIDEKLDDIKITGIKYTNKDKLSSKKTKRTIAGYNYELTYKLSEDFKETEFNSNSYSKTYYKDKDSYKNGVSFYLTIYLKNIYEAVEDAESHYSNEKTYSDVKVTNEKISNNGYDGYIYKTVYKYKSDDRNIVYENYKVMYSIDAVRIIYLELEAEENTISEDMVKNLEIVSLKKYGMYTTRNIKDGNIVTNMKMTTGKTRYEDKQKYYDVTLYVPKKYTEMVYSTQNIYDTRYFGLDYDEDANEYKYEVHYNLSHTSQENYEKRLKEEDHKNYKYKYVKDIKVGDNTFKYYQTSYTSSNGKITYYKDYLYLNIASGEDYSDNDNLSIEISTKNDIIDMNMIEGLLNVKIEEKEK